MLYIASVESVDIETVYYRLFKKQNRLFTTDDVIVAHKSSLRALVF